MTPRQQQAVELHKAIEIRKVHLRAAIARSSWRNVGILRLQIAQLSSRRMGIARAGAAAGERWAVLLLAKLRQAQALPQYRPISQPKTHYAPWQKWWPQTSYAPYQTLYRRDSGYRPIVPAQAGYHPYVPGQVGAQVPSHLSRFGVGQMAADDVEGVVEDIGLDGYGFMDVNANVVAKTSALVALGALAFGAASTRKKDRRLAMTVGIGSTVVAMMAGRKAVDQEVSGFGH